MKIATWNVNSLRVRLPQVLTWLEVIRPDVLALQETKILDQDFPVDPIKALGYDVIFSGQKTYNGMALLTLTPALNVINALPSFEDSQRRLLGAVVNGVRILNLYVPNGESIDSNKYQYKLSWINSFTSLLEKEIKDYNQLIVVGDFNIAPGGMDVYDAKSCAGKVLFSDLERQAFSAILNKGMVDCFRQLNPSLQAYSWWDYRMNAFKRNLGFRIDHILASPHLASQCHQCHIDTIQRSVERPSDHAPVVAEFKMTPLV